MYMLDIKSFIKWLLNIVFSAAGDEDLGVATTKFCEQFGKYPCCKPKMRLSSLVHAIDYHYHRPFWVLLRGNFNGVDKEPRCLLSRNVINEGTLSFQCIMNCKCDVRVWDMIYKLTSDGWEIRPWVSGVGVVAVDEKLRP